MAEPTWPRAEAGLAPYASLAAFLTARWAAAAAHELAHGAAALVLAGERKADVLTRANALDALFRRRLSVRADTLSPQAAAVARHAGWVASVAIAVAIEHARCADDGSWAANTSVRAAAWLTAVEAVSSDLLGWVRTSSAESIVFACGNFGLLLLDAANQHLVPDTLKRMVQITMARGAQCGGVVSYVPLNSKERSWRGVRSRVVNGKRTDLSKLLLDRMTSDLRLARKPHGPTFFQGHTRFATSSKVEFNGTHPHQWNSPRRYTHWRGFHSHRFTRHTESVENFITHNGDLDFVRIHGVWHETGDVMRWLERVFGVSMPASTDSVGIAGMVDLMRTQGLWFHSVRMAYHLGEDETFARVPMALRRGGGNGSLDYDGPSQASIEEVSSVLDHAFGAYIADIEENLEGSRSGLYKTGSSGSLKGLWTASLKTLRLGSSKSKAYRAEVVQRLSAAIRDHFTAKGSDSIFDDGSVPLDINEAQDSNADTRLTLFVREVVYAFFEFDLLTTLRTLMKNARGSFGVCISSSVDAHRQFAIASRGQTISIAFYPRLGMVLWGSEMAATKAALGLVDGSPSHDEVARRLDLDDTGGEVCLVDFLNDEGTTLPSTSRMSQALTVHKPMPGVRMMLAQEALVRFGKFSTRLLPLEDNPLITPLPVPSSGKDLVAQDLDDIPYVLKKIHDDFEDATTLNSMSMWTLRKALLSRVIGGTTKSAVDEAEHRMHFKDKNTIDVLVTGCEVSLWLAEQFVSDLSAVFPMLSIRCISANKLLGMLGQEVPTLGLGSQCPKESTWNIANAIVIIVTHSGGTFPSLAVAKLMPNYTNSVFAVTSDWDTEVGRQLRAMSTGGDEHGRSWESFDIKSRVFTSHAGLRFAEPCSISVAATHQVLTEIVIDLMYFTRPEYGDNGPLKNTWDAKAHTMGLDLRRKLRAGHSARDIDALRKANVANIQAVAEIVGSGHGDSSIGITAVRLRARGAFWAKHVLETPKSWIICALYILITVTWGKPLVTGVLGAFEAVFEPGTPHGGIIYRISLFIDAMIYLFCAQWSVLLLRTIEGRSLLHRLAGGRSVVIGDVPWVAQCVEAYLSKLFAVAYSAASIHVYSGNPWDHLVHRHTHRVTRGALLAVGRPDGRLAAHANSEAAVSLSLSQASSIQSLGGTCESLTVGHNQFKLPLSAHAVFLPDRRDCRGPKYACERALEQSAMARRAQKRRDDARKTSGKKIERRASNIAAQFEDMAKATSRSPGSLVGFFYNMKGGEMKDLTTVQAFALKQQESLKSFAGMSSRAILKSTVAGQDDLVRWEDFEEESIAMVMQETRFDSLQRCVSFFVLFHEMAKRVADFWRHVSFGLLAYDIHRTHSIMRVATTACPVSGMEVRDRQKILLFKRQWNTVVKRLKEAIIQYKMVKRLSSKDMSWAPASEEEEA